MASAGEEVERDPFGHVQLDKVNPGAWFGKQFAAKLGAEKVMVQKSGYFSRSAAANAEDLRLIKSCTDFAVDCALSHQAGLVGHDEDHDGQLRAIELDRIKGGKRFDPTVDWFAGLLGAIGQPVP
jgi:pyrophosphate--fructose-6-phosphate 1-phosphotransferase